MNAHSFTRSTGVTLEIPVLNYLQELAEKEDRDRSFCINYIVREHAAQHGNILAPASQPLTEPVATLSKDK